MNYSFKITTRGRELLATLLAIGKELEITRVAVGSGRVAEDVNLADMTDLVQYVAEGKITYRHHEANVLYLTVQYSSNSTPGLGAFFLSEFIIQAKHPLSGENVTFLYATLGDYIQPVNAYSETMAPDVRNYPLAIAISDEISVSVITAAGLVTYEDLLSVIESAGNIKKTINFTAPIDAWLKDEAPANGFLYYIDLIDADVTAKMLPELVVAEECMETAIFAGVYGIDTYDGYVRIKCMDLPEAVISGSCHLFAQRTESNVGGNVAVTPGIATDEEVKDAVDEVFEEEVLPEEPGDAEVPDGNEIATDEEVRNTVTDIFG